jgi:hypothetical protein
MFSIISYQGNANQMYTKIPSHSSQNYHQENEEQQMNVGENVAGGGGIKHLYTTGRNAN